MNELNNWKPSVSLIDLQVPDTQVSICLQLWGRQGRVRGSGETSLFCNTELDLAPYLSQLPPSLPHL